MRSCSPWGCDRGGEYGVPRFELMRVSLAPAEGPPDLLVGADGSAPRLTRAEYLARAFGKRRTFLHQGKSYVFDPYEMPKGYAGGYFSRENVFHGRAGPDEHYREKLMPSWELALAIIDLAQDSQVISVEFNNKVASPRPMLESFFKSLRPSEGFHSYRIDIRYLTNEETYWEVVSEYEGRITQIVFTFVPPNAFESKKEVAEFLQTATAQSHSDRSKHVYESQAGRIDPRAPLLAASAEVAMEGGGEATIRSGRKTVFTSSRARAGVDIDPTEMPTPDDSFPLMNLLRRLFGLRT